MSSIPYLDAATVSERLTPTATVDALAAALAGGLDVEADSPRLFSGLARGEFLLMPAEVPGAVGIKVLTIAPDNPAAGHPKIQGHYLLFDAQTLAPTAIIDGTALTLARTPAVTTLAVTRLWGDRPIPTLLVLGSGPQAEAHVHWIAAHREIGRVLIAGRSPERAAPLVARLAAAGLNAGVVIDAAAAVAPATEVISTAAAVAAADVIICATSSAAPVLDGTLVRRDAVVAAIGSHGLDAREVDAALVDRADIVVEARASALRESGNLLSAQPREYWESHPPANLVDLVAGRVIRRAGHPALYSAVGMAWEDLVLARLLAD
ncbi:ornithine cyclodeaminase family protein [Microbacterium invictum]|uniref:Ornithine cyclodeaminase n=1 Tax=Microbacterium invictum TaxID=515415 RepID=A0AA40SPG0_9MICO|nr:MULTISPECIES: ornithine cyclodeaminase family protein [Microbacterium]MBB4139958.1 ornithine cyclodeaminase [Microbacterium invictum]